MGSCGLSLFYSTNVLNEPLSNADVPLTVVKRKRSSAPDSVTTPATNWMMFSLVRASMPEHAHILLPMWVNTTWPDSSEVEFCDTATGKPAVLVTPDADVPANMAVAA